MIRPADVFAHLRPTNYEKVLTGQGPDFMRSVFDRRKRAAKAGAAVPPEKVEELKE
ncbi:hypothetical protein [Croceibacterium aestuarii]|uniref:hypothetical protein n=1 Tax=Croceibacterium aestuarii TaxID=3064139 RepID=UPI00272E185D|nr:hypothetical protein [Croceibacterium sp. D39]